MEGSMSAQAETLGHFGDARRASVGKKLLARVIELGTLVIRKLGLDRAGEKQIHRFLDSPAVTCEEMIETASTQTIEACRGEKIITLGSSQMASFSGREANRRGLGPAGDGMSAGFFIHPCLAISQKTGSLLGLLSAKIWTRSDEYDPTPSHLRKAEDKESFRWQEGAMKAAECLKGIAASIVVVADREGDIYGAFANRPKNVDLVVRASHDRQLCGDGLLFDAPKAWPELARAQIEVPPQRKQNTVISPARTATVTMRAGVVEIPRPRQGYDADTPESVSLTLVEIQEVDPPANAEPVVWRLLTSMEVKTAEDVREIVLIYKMRWKIEEVFRACKKDGMSLEDTQLHKSERIFKLAIIGLRAAIRTIQLVDARNGSERPATDVIEPELLPAAEAIGQTLEGRTPKQQNPHPPLSLSWLSWIRPVRLSGTEK
jgi:hypothetical protein